MVEDLKTHTDNSTDRDLEETVQAAGFANVRQARDAIRYLLTPLEQQISGREPETDEWIGRALNVEPGPPGLTVREKEAASGKYFEVVWCDEAGNVRGKAKIVFRRATQIWGVNSIAVDQSLHRDERRRIANQIYDELFRRDWMRAASMSISPAAVKARHRQYANRLEKLPTAAVRRLADLELLAGETAGEIERLLSQKSDTGS
jgi:hypothetical protein